MLTATTLSYAETPWARDCVTWYGASIPQEKRTPENCTTGRSHWDAKEYTNVGPGRSSAKATANTNYTGRTQVITSSGSYLVTQTPGTVFILQTAD